MSTGRDDEAFTWEGDDEPAIADPAVPADDAGPAQTAGTVGLPQGYVAVGKGSETLNEPSPAASESSTSDATARDESGTDDGKDVAEPARGNAGLIGVGVLAGIYALYTIGWVVGGLRMQTTAQFLIAPAVFWVNLWLAIAAPALWFATTWVLTRAARPWVRFAWLIAGAVLLLPWPFAMIGAVGQ